MKQIIRVIQSQFKYAQDIEVERRLRKDHFPDELPCGPGWYITFFDADPSVMSTAKIHFATVREAQEWKQ